MLELIVFLAVVAGCVFAWMSVNLPRPSSREDRVRLLRWKEDLLRWERYVGFILLMFGFVGLLPVAAARSHLGPISALEPLVPWTFLFGSIFLALGYFGRASISMRARGALNIFGGLLLTLALIGLIAGFSGPVGPPPPPPPKHTFTIFPSVATTAGSTVPAGAYDSCDTEAGGTTAEWTTTEGTYDASTKKFTALVAIDTDLAITDALWMEPNCLEFDHDLKLDTPVDLNGDGTNDAISYFAELVSISRTVLNTDGSNGTVNAQGFVRDGVDETGDWYLLYQTDGSVWIPACGGQRGAGTLAGACGPIAVGAHPGTAANDDVDLYLILEDRGLFAYQEPAVGSSVIIIYSLAGHTFTAEIRLNTRATTNLS